MFLSSQDSRGCADGTVVRCGNAQATQKMLRKLHNNPTRNGDTVRNAGTSIDLRNQKLERIEGLETFSREISRINASHNLITKIGDLSVVVPNLESLSVAHNKLSKPNSIRNVMLLSDLSELDLSNNNINCPLEGILEILAQCKSLKVLSLEGNPVAKAKHFRKLVVGSCPALRVLGGRAICGEERRRTDAWGRAVADGGSYVEAERADGAELNRIRSERSKANALRRSLHAPVFSGTTATMTGAHVVEGIKRAFGLRETSPQSSMISWSSRRSLHRSPDAAAARPMKTELERAKRVTESQRREIAYLKERLKNSERGGGRSVPRTGGGGGNPERGLSSPLVEQQRPAQGGGITPSVVQQAFADITWEACMSQINKKANDEGSSPKATAESQRFDPFSVLPPIPPPSAQWG